MAEIAWRYGKSPAQVLLRWHIQNGVAVIPKSVNEQRIAENIDILDFELAPDEMAAVDALDAGAWGGPDPAVAGPKLFPISISD